MAPVSPPAREADEGQPRFVGILPAAGLGSRLRPFRYPKELIPVAFEADAPRDGVRPVLAIECSLRAMRKAGVSSCFVVIADWKTEMVRYLGDGSDWDVPLAYLHRAQARGLADAIDAADAWVRDAHVCLALPDTVFAPDTTLLLLREELLRRQADLCLAVFPTDLPQHLGPVRVGDDGRILEVLDKPPQPTLFNTWGAAVWSPRFTRVLHQRVTAADVRGEVVLGDVFNEAIRHGLPTCALQFPDGSFSDVGHASQLQSLLVKDGPARR